MSAPAVGTARIRRLRGAIAEVEPLDGVSLFEIVEVGERRLRGEILRLEGRRATVQVYEDITGLGLGEPVVATGESLTVALGPGLLGSIRDGVGRSLPALVESSGSFVEPGAVPEDPIRRWQVHPVLEPGREVREGEVVATVEETPALEHRILVPPGIEGRLATIEHGKLAYGDAVAALEDGTQIPLHQRWPVRAPRPVAERLPPDRPLITGQRVFDLLFPVAEGGSVAVPGGFGTGKTVIEQSLAAHAAADVVIFVGCGERGNEMAELLADLPALEDPRTGRSLMERTVLVVNTSNMPVVAREGSIYLGMTIAEYYRDMGYRVALTIDSLSRWAEALRELVSHLGEMPGEEGYPTSLASQLGRYFERAGRVRPLGRPDREGSLSLVAAVSPPGGDFSEPVTQASLRVCGALWALDSALAQSRQFPAVSWESSYSLYTSRLDSWFAGRVDERWPELRLALLELLERESELRELAGLVGADALQAPDRLVLEVGRMAREHVLGQNAFDPADQVSAPAKTLALARLVVSCRQRASEALEAGRSLDEIDLETVSRALGELRAAPPDRLDSNVERAEASIHQLAGEAA